jgi:peptidoglycan hydrolase-like protein with peptidoglycan-binding domain
MSSLTSSVVHSEPPAALGRTVPGLLIGVAAVILTVGSGEGARLPTLANACCVCELGAARNRLKRQSEGQVISLWRHFSAAAARYLGEMASVPGQAGRPGRGALAILALVIAAALGTFGSASPAAGKAAVSKARPGAAAPVATVPLQTSTSTSTSTTTTLPPLAVLEVTPANKAKAVGPSTPVVVTYNRAPGPGVALPTISPSTPGHWGRAAADRLVFKPTGYWGPGTTYRVSVPGGAPAAASTVVEFSTALPSLLALQQYLAMLGYLPLRFTPTGEIPNRKAVLQREPTSPNLVPQIPAAGVFTWAYPGIRTSLWAQWHRAQANVVTTGAVMQFEVAQGLVPDGDATPAVWDALLKAIAKRQMDTGPYDYVIVSESLPETLYVWQDGKFVYNTLTNTGVPGAATPQGTWPVDYKQNPNLMKGCDVDGYCYSVWVAYASYFLPSVGDAIHAYPRYGYGYPQSNGCVEVEPSQGATVYGYDPVGTLVTVSSWVGPAQQS